MNTIRLLKFLPHPAPPYLELGEITGRGESRAMFKEQLAIHTAEATLLAERELDSKAQKLGADIILETSRMGGGYTEPHCTIIGKALKFIT